MTMEPLLTIGPLLVKTPDRIWIKPALDMASELVNTAVLVMTPVRLLVMVPDEVKDPVLAIVPSFVIPGPVGRLVIAPALVILPVASTMSVPPFVSVVTSKVIPGPTSSVSGAPSVIVAAVQVGATKTPPAKIHVGESTIVNAFASGIENDMTVTRAAIIGRIKSLFNYQTNLG